MEKNYEERFQQLKSSYNHEVDLYNTMQKSCDERISEINRKIAKLNEKKQKIEREKKELKYPHYLQCLLPQVMGLLNEAVAHRGYQFEIKDYMSFGLSCETPVFQDYGKSERVTTAHFTFRPCDDKEGVRGFALKKKSGEYQSDTSICALNDMHAVMLPVDSFQMLLDHIEECERNEPPKMLTEDELIELMPRNLWAFRCSPQSLWTYRTVTAAMNVAKECYVRFEDAERIPESMVDKEMFLLGLEAGVYFYHFLSKEKLEELGAYEEDFLIEQIRCQRTSVYDIPDEKMTVGVLKGIIPYSGYWECKKLINRHSSLLNQEIADLMIKESLSLIEFMPDRFKTFEMCQKVYKECKSCRKYIPSRYLTESGRMKKKPC